VPVPTPAKGGKGKGATIVQAITRAAATGK
jgi:hypothetical protein